MKHKAMQAPNFAPLLFQALDYTSKIGGSDTRCRRVADGSDSGADLLVEGRKKYIYFERAL